MPGEVCGEQQGVREPPEVYEASGLAESHHKQGQ